MSLNKKSLAIFLVAYLTLVASGCMNRVGLKDANISAQKSANSERPNILLIVADDLGFNDLGAYGSNINTPNIDTLAQQGMLFTQFHTSPKCAPTRAMLLSGNNNHVAGMARQSTKSLAGQKVPGYEASLSDRILPFPKLLQASGYHTYTVGKWHLGTTPETSPTAAGFSRSFSLLDGAGNHWDNVGFFEGGSTFWADGDYTKYPDGEYSTQLYTTKLIEFIDSQQNSQQPFFAFAAYTSPHWPLQVPEHQLDLYKGVFDEGYDVLREANFERAKAVGVIDASHRLPPRNESITPWVDLSPEQQKRESRKMELYAAMVENLDQHVGRLITHLKSRGLYDNTLIVFMSDNGAAAEDFYHKGPFVEYLQKHYDNSFDKMGGKESFVSYGPQWAEAGSAPFSRHKTYPSQGGIVTPLIMAAPFIKAKPETNNTYLTLMDLAPTFLELAGVEYPTSEKLRPMLGASMLPFLIGNKTQVHNKEYVTTLFHGGRAFLRQGDWKITMLSEPFEESKFELFNLSDDPGETENLAGTHPEKYKELINLWRVERAKLGIILPEDL